MNRRLAFAPLILLAPLAMASFPTLARGADEAAFTRQEDVIYGRKYGTALTMDVFRPTRAANGAAIVLAVSGGFFSSHEAINPAWSSR